MVLAVVAHFIATDARAQGFDGQRYVPPAGAAGGLLVERAVIPNGTTGSGALFLNFADDPVVVSEVSSGEILYRPIHGALAVDVMGSFAVGGRFEIAAHLPVLAVVDGDPLGTFVAAPGLGDLRVVPKFTFLGGPDEEGFRLGAAIPVRFPTGDGAALRGSEAVTLAPELLLGLKEDRVRLHASLGYRARLGVDPAAPIGNEFTWGLAGAVGLIDGRAGLDLLIEGQGGVDVTRDGPQLTDVPLELLAGLEARPTRDVAFTLAAGPGLTDGLGTPDYRVVFGFRFSPHPEASPSDDEDRDRVVDSRDRCPAEPEDHDGFHDRDGCPEADNDGDNIADDNDECPMVAEEPGGDGDGCPDGGHVRVTGKRIEVDGKILFAFDSDEIDRRSFPLLDELAQVLRDHPNIERVYIQGHTDDVGELEYNDDLSQRRANSVRAALIARGIDADRLITKGYGERRPIAPNDTPAGRAQNRRVEFLLKE